MRRGMKRVMVMGCSGSGKSTVARRLGEILGLPVIHLDRYYWRPGWMATPIPEWREKVKELVAGEEWVLDGNFASGFDLTMPRADLIFLHDFPLWRCLWRVCKRVVKFQLGEKRLDMAEGCPEKWDWEFIEWIWNFDRDYRPRILGAVEVYEKSVVVARTPEEVERFLEKVRMMRGA